MNHVYLQLKYPAVEDYTDVLDDVIDTALISLGVVLHLCSYWLSRSSTGMSNIATLSYTLTSTHLLNEQ